MPCNIPCRWKRLAFVRKWPLLLDVQNGNGQTTLCRRRCEKTLQQLHMCQAIVPHSKACKHDYLLPGGAEWLPHCNTIAEPTAICYAVCVLIHMSCHDEMRVKKQARSITTQRFLCWQTPKEHSFAGCCMQQWCTGSWLSVVNWDCKGVTWSESS
jgi:hypothetical protein